jgi:hypothetical protein
MVEFGFKMNLENEFISLGKFMYAKRDESIIKIDFILLIVFATRKESHNSIIDFL